MAPKVIGIVGPQGSGKTEVAKTISELGVPCVRMGDLVWDEVKRRGQEVTEENVARVAGELRERLGQGAVAKLCIPLIKRVGKDKPAVVVDGIRSEAEVKEFRRMFHGDFYLIAVQCGEKIRYSRIASRRRADDANTMEKFVMKDQREESWGLEGAMKSADFTIVNEGTLEELRERAVEVYKKVVGEHV